MNDKERAFLLGLEKLTRETGMKVVGCGCCGSPALEQASPEELAEEAGYGFGYAEEVSWIAPCNKYSWEHYGSGIARA